MIRDVKFFKGYKERDRVVHFTDYLLELSDRSTSAKTFRSGFNRFDQKLGGVQTGEVVTISGHTKNGKTLLAESWLHGIRARDQSAKVMVLSFEMQPERMLVKYMSDEHTQIYLPTELKTMDFEWLKDRCKESIVKFNANILLIDHLHFMVDMNTNHNMSLNIGAFMRRLKKDIAVDMNMAVVLIAHQSSEKDGQAATSKTIRDSSFVGQESDSVICINRRKNFDTTEFNKLYDTNPTIAEAIERYEIKPEAGELDDYSQCLAMASIERARRSGTFEYKKLFQKRGHFLEEV